jgi:tetratricopeptide (TPR) repeat protein
MKHNKQQQLSHRQEKKPLLPRVLWAGIAVMAAGLAGVGICNRAEKPNQSAQNSAPAAAVESLRTFCPRPTDATALAGGQSSAIAPSGASAVESEVQVAQPISLFLSKVHAPDIGTKTLGNERIMIEMADSPSEAAAYAKKYDELVSAISTVLKRNFGADLSDEHVMGGMWTIVRKFLHMSYAVSADQSMPEALRSGTFDCQSSSFLFFDVAKQLGMKVEMAFVPMHVLIKTETHFIETTSGNWYPLRDIRKYRPLVYAITSDPQKIESVAYQTRGVVYAKEGNHQQAIAYYTKAIGLNSAIAEYYYGRAVSYCALGMHQEEIDDYTDGIRLNPEQAAYCNRANAYFALGKFREAIKDYDEIISLNPKYARAYNGLGNAYDKLGDLQRALWYYAKAIGLKPTEACFYANRASIWTDLGKPGQAAVDLSKAIALDSGNATSYNNRGGAYFALGKFQLAIDDFDKAIMLDSAYANAYNGRGGSYYSLGKAKQAIADFSRAIGLDPGRPDLYANRAIAYAGAGMEREAEADRQTYLALQKR